MQHFLVNVKLLERGKHLSYSRKEEFVLSARGVMEAMQQVRQRYPNLISQSFTCIDKEVDARGG